VPGLEALQDYGASFLPGEAGACVSNPEIVAAFRGETLSVLEDPPGRERADMGGTVVR
jgi:hypothetical protein